MRTPGKPEELECQRLQALALLEAGHGPSEVARRLGVSPGAVSRWKKLSQQAGRKGLKAQPHPGPRPKLTGRQRRDLERLLLKGPLAHGYLTDLWTLKRIAEVIEKQFGVRYDLSGVWHVLRRMGWSCRRPEGRARERDEGAIARWRQRDWPRIKKARRCCRPLVFLDETGFMLQPVVRRTWGPQGDTPRQYRWERHDRLSGISVVTVSPKRRHLDLYFTLQEHNIQAAEVETFVAELLHHFPHGIILVLDRWPVHFPATDRLRQRLPRRIRIEWLPSYAPELNPDELVWTRTKYGDLANFCPDNLTELTQAVRRSLEQTKSHPLLLRSFFEHAGLKL
jgi:transposase